MDPLTMYAIIQGGISAYNALSGSDQDRQSFEGTDHGPNEMLSNLKQILNGYGEAATNQLRKPIQLRSAYAQPLPTFSGGGLPMPIGLYGKDPALEFAQAPTGRDRATANGPMNVSTPRYRVNMDYLTLPGMDFPQGLFPGPSVGPSNNTPTPPPDERVPSGGSDRGGSEAQSQLAPTGQPNPEADQILSWFRTLKHG